MIAHINKEYIFTCSQEWVALLISTLARNNHLVDCDNGIREFIEQCIRKHCSTIENEFIRTAPFYEITSLKRKHLTTIEVDGSFTQNEYLNLFGEPSLVLLENAPYEWPVYVNMMEIYKKDRQYSNIFAMLRKAAIESPRTLRELHAGGNGHFEAIINLKEKTPEYKGLTKYKIYPVTDSDRESESAHYQPTPKRLYRLFCGITNKDAEVDRNHIDTFNQPHYNWHMWKKRAIENYFPPEAYENIGLNADHYRSHNIPERYYKKVDDEINKYNKKDLENVAASMSRNDYETISDKFMIDGVKISEIRLFLLKMAKVV